MARGDLSEEEWHIIEPFLPRERGRKSRPAYDNRRFLDEMLHVLRVGCPQARYERARGWHRTHLAHRRIVQARIAQLLIHHVRVSPGGLSWVISEPGAGEVDQFCKFDDAHMCCTRSWPEAVTHLGK